MLAGVQMLAYLRRVEKRCAAIFKARLDHCQHLTTTPFSLTPWVIFWVQRIPLQLWLNRRRIGDNSMAAFARALGSGALPQITELYLCYNEIGDTGLSALASACASGAMAQLQVSLRPTALSHALRLGMCVLQA